MDFSFPHFVRAAEEEPRRRGVKKLKKVEVEKLKCLITEYSFWGRTDGKIQEGWVDKTDPQGEKLDASPAEEKAASCAPVFL